MISKCESCKWRLRAEKKPDSIISKIWRWHMAYYLVPGLEEISAGTGQWQEWGLKGKRGHRPPFILIAE